MSKSNQERKNKKRPQDVTARMMMDMGQLRLAYMDMAQKVAAMSPIVQQMIVVMVLLEQKGIITNVEIAEKQQELMQPIEPGFHDLSSKIEGGSGEAGQGSSEAVEGKSQEAGEDGSANPDGDSNEGVSGGCEVQSERTRTVEGDVGSNKPRLSPNPSEGSDQSSEHLESDGKSDGSADVPGSTDSGIKTADVGKD